MTEIVLGASKYSIPTTFTAAIIFSLVGGQDQLPSRYYPLTQNNLTGQIWEEPYTPSLEKDEDLEKIATVQMFASLLINESEDIPENFANLINEDFWDII